MFHYNHFILKMSIWKLVCIDCFTCISFGYMPIVWLIWGYPTILLQLPMLHIELISRHNLHEFQIPNIPSSILINLFSSIKFYFYINIRFFGCRYYRTFLWHLHIKTKIIDFKWFHFCECHVINKYKFKPMAYFLYVMPILYMGESIFGW